MKKETITLMFDPDSTPYENEKKLEEYHAMLERAGNRVVGVEPIRQTYSKVIGRRYIVEMEG